MIRVECDKCGAGMSVKEQPQPVTIPLKGDTYADRVGSKVELGPLRMAGDVIEMDFVFTSTAGEKLVIALSLEQWANIAGEIVGRIEALSTAGRRP